MSIYLGNRLLSGSSAVAGIVSQVTNITNEEGDNAIVINQETGAPAITLSSGQDDGITFWAGTGAEYDALQDLAADPPVRRDQNTIYYVTDR